MKRIANVRSRTATAFTLVEMLVVIAVIGILAGIILTAIPAITGKKIRSRVAAEMAPIESAIDGYKQKKGFYPPSGTDPETNSLYYELTAQALEDALTNHFQSVATVNFGSDDTYNFLKNVRPNQVLTETINGKTAKRLIIGTPGTNGLQYAVWNYTATSPTRHNHESFDLWVNVRVNGNNITIGNWKD